MLGEGDGFVLIEAFFHRALYAPHFVRTPVEAHGVRQSHDPDAAARRGNAYTGSLTLEMPLELRRETDDDAGKSPMLSMLPPSLDATARQVRLRSRLQRD